MVSWQNTVKTTLEEKAQELSLGQLGARVDMTQKKAVLYYQLPSENMLPAIGMIGFERRLEERLVKCLGTKGLHIANIPEEFEGKQSLRVELSDQAYSEFMEIERYNMIQDSAAERETGGGGKSI